MGKTYDIASIGVIAYDTVLRTIDDGIVKRDTTVLDEVSVSVGGNAMIQSLVSRTLGCNTVILGKVSNDAFGKYCLDTLDDVGVDRKHVVISDDVEMLMTFALVRDDGNRHFLGYPGSNNQTLVLSDINIDVIKDANIVSYGSFYWLRGLDDGDNTTIFKIAKEAGALTVADCADDSFNKGQEIVLRNLQYLDYFIPSFLEAKYISGENDLDAMAKVFFKRGCKNVVIKLGEKGCYVNDGNQSRIIPAFIMENCCDTTGAGDTFVGGFNAGIAEGMDVFSAARYGCAAAAVSVTGMGGFSALKSKSQVLDLINAGE